MLCPTCGSEAFCDDCINTDLQLCYADTLNQYLQTSAYYLNTLSCPASELAERVEAVQV
jgi:hypothetical protein